MKIQNKNDNYDFKKIEFTLLWFRREGDNIKEISARIL